MKKTLNEKIRTTISKVVGIFIIFAVLFCETKWEVNPILEESLMLFACVMATIGAFGRIWCSLYIAGYKDRKLITEGPYSLCRNPLYFFSFVGAVGTCFGTETFSIPMLAAVAFILYYPSTVKGEEARLKELFGKEFDDYCQTTPRFIPNFFRRPSQPDLMEVMPKKFTKSFLDAVWFVWIIGFFELAEGLREAGIIPTLFKLY